MSLAGALLLQIRDTESRLRLLEVEAEHSRNRLVQLLQEGEIVADPIRSFVLGRYRTRAPFGAEGMLRALDEDVSKHVGQLIFLVSTARVSGGMHGSAPCTVKKRDLITFALGGISRSQIEFDLTSWTFAFPTDWHCVSSTERAPVTVLGALPEFKHIDYLVDHIRDIEPEDRFDDVATPSRCVAEIFIGNEAIERWKNTWPGLAWHVDAMLHH